MTNLKELDLRNCSITTLDDFFDNLPFLEKLFLSNNRIVNVSDDTFGSLAHLNHLDLSYNKLWDFTPYSVTDPFQVYLSGMMLHEDVFRNLTNLVFLDLSHSKLKQESLRALQWLQPRLEQLSLCYTDVPLIISGMFAQTNLKVLDLSGNPGLISSLSNLWFSGLEEKLEILIFRSSNLKQIALIRNLRALKMLDLSKLNIN
jgi:Leucine-rich repeat (LRR) protein